MARICQRRLRHYARRSRRPDENRFRSRVPDPIVWGMQLQRIAGIQHAPDHHYARLSSRAMADRLHWPRDIQCRILAFAIQASRTVADDLRSLGSQMLDPVLGGENGSAALFLVRA